MAPLLCQRNSRTQDDPHLPALVNEPSRRRGPTRRGMGFAYQTCPSHDNDEASNVVKRGIRGGSTQALRQDLSPPIMYRNTVFIVFISHLSPTHLSLISLPCMVQSKTLTLDGDNQNRLGRVGFNGLTQPINCVVQPAGIVFRQ